MNITVELLKEHNACPESITFLQCTGLIGFPLDKVKDIKGDYLDYVLFLKTMIKAFKKGEVLQDLDAGFVSSCTVKKVNAFHSTYTSGDVKVHRSTVKYSSGSKKFILTHIGGQQFIEYYVYDTEGRETEYVIANKLQRKSTYRGKNLVKVQKFKYNIHADITDTDEYYFCTKNGVLKYITLNNEIIVEIPDF